MLSKEGSMERAICTNDNEQAYRKRAECRDELLRFYYSKKSVKETRKKQVLAKKFKEKLCSRECKYANPKEANKDKKRLLMFIGGKETGGRIQDKRASEVWRHLALCHSWKKHQRLHHQ
jgi:hypothetical protein